MELERRIRAAQVLGGFKSLDDLAAAIGREDSGMSRKTLRRIASDTDPRQAKDYELVWIAEACGVPLSFFAGDIDTVSGSQLDRIEQQLADVARREDDAIEQRDGIRALLAQQSQILKDIAGLLVRQDQILGEIQRVVAGMPDDDALRILNEAAQQLVEIAEAEEAARDEPEEGEDETGHGRATG